MAFSYGCPHQLVRGLQEDLDNDGINRMLLLVMLANFEYWTELTFEVANRYLKS